MRTVWATVLSVWALFAVVAVLAWTRQQPAGAPAQGPSAVVVRGKNGKQQLVLLQGANTASSTHATTRTSPVPAG